MISTTAPLSLRNESHFIFYYHLNCTVLLEAIGKYQHKVHIVAPAGVGDIWIIIEGANNCIDDEAGVFLLVQEDIACIFPDKLIKPKPKEPFSQLTLGI
jgi:hypothetical protein